MIPVFDLKWRKLKWKRKIKLKTIKSSEKRKKKAGNSSVQWSWIAGRDFHCYGKKTPRSCTKLYVLWRKKNLSRKFASSNNEPEQFHPSFPFLFVVLAVQIEEKQKTVFIFLFLSTTRHFNILTMMWPIFCSTLPLNLLYNQPFDF